MSPKINSSKPRLDGPEGSGSKAQGPATLGPTTITAPAGKILDALAGLGHHCSPRPMTQPTPEKLPTPPGSSFTVYTDPSGTLQKGLPVDQWRAGDGWAEQSDFTESGLDWDTNTDVGLLRQDWDGHKAGSLVISGMWTRPQGVACHEDRCEAIAIRPRRASDAWLERGPGAKTTDKKIVLTSTLRSLYDSGLGYGDYQAKESFHKEGLRVLRALAKEMGLAKGTFDVHSNKGGIAVGGEITLHTPKVYIQISGSGYMGKGQEIMYRTCQGQRDYTGGRNHFAALEDVLNVTEFAIRMKNLEGAR